MHCIYPELMTKSSPQITAATLLAWYDRHARELVWRIPPGSDAHPDPYKVWLSEIMLQQTTAPHAAPYYVKFLGLWPTVEDLAAASIDDVTREWAGLGYYARARNLHKCAKAVAERGGFPGSVEGLQELPGVGPYTSAAIGAIAFGLPVAPVDGNIERVISRVFAIAGDGSAKGWAADKKEISQRVNAQVPPDRSGDFAQALMDLGATICTPKRPDCMLCPWTEGCAARREGTQGAYPAKPKKKPQPERIGHAFVLVNGDKVLMERRPPSGLLGGMLMPPGSEWVETAEMAQAGAPVEADWALVGVAKHVFTHFRLRIQVWRADGNAHSPGFKWVHADDALAAAPTIGRKVLKLAISS